MIPDNPALEGLDFSEEAKTFLNIIELNDDSLPTDLTDDHLLTLFWLSAAQTP